VGEYGPRYRALGVTLLGDDLYCKQPLCEAFVRQGLNFILVCKPDSHKTLYEWVAGLAATGDVQTLEVKRRQGKHRYTDTYRFVNHVPLRDGEGALEVNWCELTTTRQDGKVVYKNAFATNHRITEANVADIESMGSDSLKRPFLNSSDLLSPPLGFGRAARCVSCSTRF
jgi:hypothetical protein